MSMDFLFTPWISLKLIRALVLGSGLAFSPLWVTNLPAMLRGPWVDHAVSQVLSQNYGAQVRVQNVQFQNWRHIEFDSFAIDSLENGNPMVRSKHGSLHLRHMRLLKKSIFETEIRFENLVLMREYYGRRAEAKPWGFLMKKPLVVDELALKVVQGPTATEVGIVSCRSKDIQIAGGLSVDRSGKKEDKLHITISPWTAVKSIF